MPKTPPPQRMCTQTSKYCTVLKQSKGSLTNLGVSGGQLINFTSGVRLGLLGPLVIRSICRQTRMRCFYNRQAHCRGVCGRKRQRVSESAVTVKIGFSHLKYSNIFHYFISFHYESTAALIRPVNNNGRMKRPLTGLMALHKWQHFIHR